MRRIALVFVCLILIISMIPALPSTVKAAPILNPGDAVQVINTLSTGLAVRNSPAGSTVITRKYDGTTGSVISGPISAVLGGIVYSWWEVRWGDDGQQGWSAGGYPGGVDYLLKQTKPVSTKFSVGQKVRIVNMGSYNYRVRNDPPGLSLQSVSKHENDTGKIIMDSMLASSTYYGVPDISSGAPLHKGPNNDYFYPFWKIQWDSDGQIGWSAEGAIDGDYLAPVSYVTLTLYVHEDNISGPIIAGAQVTGQDGAGNPFNQTTNSSGYVIITGVSGTWSFTVSKSGYQTNSWSQSITETGTKHAFLFVAPPTTAPTLLLPSNGATDISVTPTFQWQSVSGATYYGLYVSEPPYGPDHLVFDSELDYGLISGTSLTLPISLANSVTYYWNMRAGNNAGWGPFSPSRSFTTQELPPEVLIAYIQGRIDPNEEWFHWGTLYTDKAELTIGLRGTESQNRSNVTIVRYEWDFGDGQTAQGEYITHTYTTGNYNTTLTVYDEAGNSASETLRIEVRGGEPSVLYVPDNYSTIQTAVDTANAGDTIIVRDGIYTENINIDTANLTIRSENGAEATIVQAANSNDHVFEVLADYVNISGFTVKGATDYQIGDPVQWGGFFLYSVCNCTINNSISVYNYVGIYLINSDNTSLMNNNINNNQLGIILYESSSNALNSNNIYENDHGVVLSVSVAGST